MKRIVMLLSLWSLAAFAGVDLFIVNPTWTLPVLPNKPLEDDFLGSTLKMVLAPGETHAVSFVARSADGYSDFLVKPQELTGNNGAVIPAADLDARVVKCWYQSGTAWVGIAQDIALRVLVPELLLHDDKLVKVDHTAKKNYLRLSKPEGDEYVDISDSSVMRPTGYGNWPRPTWPVYDAPTMKPLELPAGENRQFVITYTAPQDIHPGTYTGFVDLTSGKTQVGRLKLTVEILPFKLAEPKTNYDIDKEFTASLYYHTLINPGKPVGNLHPYHRSHEQIMAELRNMVRHNVTNPCTVQGSMYQDFLDENNRALWHKLMDMRAEAGMKNHQIFVCNNAYLNLKFNKDYTGTTPEDIAQFIERAETVMDWIRSRTGRSTEIYFYGIDEAKDDNLRAQLPAWRALHAAGGKTWASGYKESVRAPGNFALVGEELDVLNDAFAPDPSESAKWHSLGKRVFNYSNPQSGPENPDLHRRNYGLSLYLDNYDGVCNFKYISLFGDPWNDFDSNVHRDHAYVYPTQDGVVDTLAWEGFREAIDDIRYITTLRHAIRAAIASGDVVRMETARQAEAWIANLAVTDYSLRPNEPLREQFPDLEKLRLEMIDWILKLQQK